MVSLSYRSKVITAILIATSAFFMVRFANVATPPFLPIIFIIILATPTIVDFIKSQNKFKAIYLYLLFTVLAIMVEYIGVKTGFPYGNFSYSDFLPLKIGGEVPITLCLTFVPLLIGAFAIVQKISKNKIVRIFLTTLFLVLADLVLDPGAVHIKMWTFEQTGLYYGVPLTNFLGWIFSGLIFSTLAVLLLNNVTFNYKKASFTYQATLWYWTIACLTAGLIVPVIIGIVILSYLNLKDWK